MDILKRYIAGDNIVNQIFQDYIYDTGSGDQWGTRTVETFKDITGTDRNTLTLQLNSQYSTYSYGTTGGVVRKNLSLFSQVQIYPSTETEENFDRAFYDIESPDIVGIVQNKVESKFSNSRLYSFEIKNESEDTIIINSLKFIKNLTVAGYKVSGQSGYYETTVNAPVFVIYLENPVTIEAGQTEELSIRIKI